MFQTYVVFDESQGLLKPLKKLAYELDSQSKDLHDWVSLSSMKIIGGFLVWFYSFNVALGHLHETSIELKYLLIERVSLVLDFDGLLDLNFGLDCYSI